ncbi:MAG: diaminopimelate epimerase [Sphingobacteriales bacterium]|nr:diaminopimelate epimerase [Sphingobacteriales bacterium]
MLQHFYKYQGAGNDFVMIDNRLQTLLPDKTRFARWCHRRFGVGADGVILLQQHPDYDFEMRYFNADGGEGSMCGNGGRCAIAFAQHLGIIQQKTIFLATDGTHEGEFSEHIISLKMNKVQQWQKRQNSDFVLDTGSPHYVRFVENAAAIDAFALGKSIRYSPEFEQKGINVNFVQQTATCTLQVRTYERGVEDETFACGTGVTAAAITSALLQQLPEGNHTFDCHTQGGLLKVSFVYADDAFSEIWLQGGAERVFEGTIFG